MANSNYQPFPSFTRWQAIPVGGSWLEFLAILNELKKTADDATKDRALSYVLRSAALETGALEGLYSTNRGVTRTVAIQAAQWEVELHELGTDVPGHFKAQLAAFELIFDAATSATPISEAWLRRVHETVCAAQSTYRVLTQLGWQDRALERGVYKTEPNNVTLKDGSTHWYASPADVPGEMHRLMEEIRSEAFLAANPILQASFAHYAFVAIHPFADGNGRLARVFASVFLYRAAGIPLVIFSDQQLQYWDALATADLGKNEPFVRFVEARAVDTLMLVTANLREAINPLDQQAALLHQTFRVPEGITEAEAQAIGRRIGESIRDGLRQQIQDLKLPPDVSFWIEEFPGHIDCTFWDRPYKSLGRGGMSKIHFDAQAPGVRVEMTPIVGRAVDPVNEYTYIVVDANRPNTAPLLLRLMDMHPLATAAAESLIESWEKTALSALLAELGGNVRASNEQRQLEERGW